MSKVTFATSKYVQDEIEKLRRDVEEGTNTELELLKKKHDKDMEGINKDISDLETTVNNDIKVAIENTNNTINDFKVEINNSMEDLSQNILVENIAYKHPDYSNIANVKQALDRLLYTDLAVTFTTTSATTNEMGTSMSGVVFNWTTSRKVVKQSIDNVDIHVDSNIYRYPTAITTDKTVTLKVNDGTKDFSSSIKFTFLNGFYYGASNKTSGYDSDFVKTLRKDLASSRQKTISVTANSGQYIFICIPKRFGTPTFLVNGFEGGFNKSTTFQFTNPSGYKEDYDVYRSTNTNLGNTTITVK